MAACIPLNPLEGTKNRPKRDPKSILSPPQRPSTVKGSQETSKRVPKGRPRDPTGPPDERPVSPKLRQDHLKVTPGGVRKRKATQGGPGKILDSNNVRKHQYLPCSRRARGEPRDTIKLPKGDQIATRGTQRTTKETTRAIEGPFVLQLH